MPTDSYDTFNFLGKAKLNILVRSKSFQLENFKISQGKHMMWFNFFSRFYSYSPFLYSLSYIIIFMLYTKFQSSRHKIL